MPLACLACPCRSSCGLITPPCSDLMEYASADSQPQTWQLPTALQLHILSLLPPNERALSGPFVCREACDALSEPQHCTASLSQPLPPHAAPWAIKAGQEYMRQVPLKHKFQLLCTAARSGSEVNLEVAWVLLQPSVFPELLLNQESGWSDRVSYCDPGLAAVKAGHPQLLSWLMRHCPVLVWADEVLMAAVEHCDLAGLQAAWDAVAHAPGRNSSVGSSGVDFLHGAVLHAAAAAKVPDAVAKTEWMLASGAGKGRLRAAAYHAVRSGDLDRLRWLQQRGCKLVKSRNVGQLPGNVMTEADLGVVQCLVEQGECSLPGAGTDGRAWELLMQSAAKSADGVVKLRWLQEQGAPPLGSDEQLMHSVAVAAAEAGQLEVVLHLLSVSGQAGAAMLQASPKTFSMAAACSGSIASAEQLQQAGLVFGIEAYGAAAEAGHSDMLRWLTTEAGVPTGWDTLLHVIGTWPCDAPSDSRTLLAAVEVLVETSGLEVWCPALELDRAARRGDLALVQYLHGLDWPLPLLWPEASAMVEAALGGCEALLEWLAGHPGFLEGPGSGSPYVAAATFGDRAMLEALRRLGVPWGGEDVVVQAVEDGCCMPVLRWLVEAGAPVGSREAMESVVAKRMDRGCEKAAWLLALAGPAAEANCAAGHEA